MELLPADYVLLALAAVCALTGLFRGLSGTLAFFVAVFAALAGGYAAWIHGAAFLENPWLRGLAAFVCALLAYGIARLIVKKLVNGLLAQPSDALLGLLAGLLVPLLAVVFLARAGLGADLSNIVQTVQSVTGAEKTQPCASY